MRQEKGGGWCWGGRAVGHVGLGKSPSYSPVCHLALLPLPSLVACWCVPALTLT